MQPRGDPDRPEVIWDLEDPRKKKEREKLEGGVLEISQRGLKGLTHTSASSNTMLPTVAGPRSVDVSEPALTWLAVGSIEFRMHC